MWPSCFTKEGNTERRFGVRHQFERPSVSKSAVSTSFWLTLSEEPVGLRRLCWFRHDHHRSHHRNHSRTKRRGEPVIRRPCSTRPVNIPDECDIRGFKARSDLPFWSAHIGWPAWLQRCSGAPRLLHHTFCVHLPGVFLGCLSSAWSAFNNNITSFLGQCQEPEVCMIMMCDDSDERE